MVARPAVCSGRGIIVEASAVLIFEKWLPYVLTTVAGLIIALIFFAIQLWRFGPQIKKLNNIETITKLAYFADQHEQAALAFGKAGVASDVLKSEVEKFRNDLEGLRDFIAEAQARISEVNAEAITQARLAMQPHAGSAVITAGPRDVEIMYKDMMQAWDRFIEAFRQRLEDANIAPNMRRLSRMTYELTDRRRRNPIGGETAELISALHSQYKRYVRMQATKNFWLTPDVRENFLQLIDTAIDELQRSSQHTESGLAMVGSANGDAGRTLN